MNVGICDNGDKEHVPSIRIVHKFSQFTLAENEYCIFTHY
jgi:hypothetical protein